MAYTYISWSALRNQLAARLSDPAKVFFSDDELKTALAEAMRLWNVLTGYWKERVQFSTTAGQAFYDIPSVAKDTAGNLARAYTVTDTQLINEMCAHLLEHPPAGGVWAGTEMFTFDDLVKALERRRNQFLNETGCVVTHFTNNVPPNTIGRVAFPDTTVLLRRVAWFRPVDPLPICVADQLGQAWQLGVEDDGSLSATAVTAASVPFVLLSDDAGLTWQLTAVSSAGETERTVDWQIAQVESAPAPSQLLCTSPSGVTSAVSIESGVLATQLGATPRGSYSNLHAEDEFAASSFQNNWMAVPAQPLAYSIADVSPLQLQLMPVPLDKGSLDVLAVQTPEPLTGQGVLMNIPDDLVWAVKWGALADLLSDESEASDNSRALYCESRYEQGVQLAQFAPSVLRSQINDFPVVMASVAELDAFNPSWQNTQKKPTFAAMAGQNLMSLAPVPDQIYGVSVDVVQNAPIPVNDADKVQVGREQLGVILDFAQHVLSFKQGGMEFAETRAIMQNLLRLANVEAEHLKALSMYAEVTMQEAQAEQQMRPRSQ